MDDTVAGDPTPDVDQQHVCFLFQKVLLCRMDDVFGADFDPSVYTEKRRQRHWKHEVSLFA